MAHRFDEVIEQARRLGLREAHDPRWGTARTELLPSPDHCSAFLEWARQHRKWQFNVAEAADQVCAKPVEAAIFVLADIVDELEDEAEA